MTVAKTPTDDDKEKEDPGSSDNISSVPWWQSLLHLQSVCASLEPHGRLKAVGLRAAGLAPPGWPIELSWDLTADSGVTTTSGVNSGVGTSGVGSSSPLGRLEKELAQMRPVALRYLYQTQRVRNLTGTQIEGEPEILAVRDHGNKQMFMVSSDDIWLETFTKLLKIIQRHNQLIGPATAKFIAWSIDHGFLLSPTPPRATSSPSSASSSSPSHTAALAAALCVWIGFLQKRFPWLPSTTSLLLCGTVGFTPVTPELSVNKLLGEFFQLHGSTHPLNTTVISCRAGAPAMTMPPPSCAAMIVDPIVDRNLSAHWTSSDVQRWNRAIAEEAARTTGGDLLPIPMMDAPNAQELRIALGSSAQKAVDQECSWMRQSQHALAEKVQILQNSLWWTKRQLEHYERRRTTVAAKYLL